MIYADIKYSKELAWLFPDAEWWFRNNGQIMHKSEKHAFDPTRPAITTDMALEVLPKVLKEKDTINDFMIFWQDKKIIADYGKYQTHAKSLPNALCKMIQYLVKEGVIKHE